MYTNKTSTLKLLITIFTSLIVSVTLLLLLENVLESQQQNKHDASRHYPRRYYSFENRTRYSKNDRLINLKNFKYLLNNETKCQRSNNILAIFIVTSYESHIEERSAMRRIIPETKLNELNIKRVFLLAQAPPTDKYAIPQNAIIDEQRRYGDLIQGNFIEAYRNLTYKHIMGLSWVAQYCNNANFVIKMDDDIVIDFYRVVEMLRNLTKSNRHKDLFLAGYIFRGMSPKRDPANKWYVNYREYSKPMYPPFLSGWFYITTPQVAKLFTNLSRNIPYFWIDDVYVTGILVKILNIKHRDIHKIFTANSAFLECCIRDVIQYAYECEVAVGPNGGNADLFVRFNEVLFKCRAEHNGTSLCKQRPPGKGLTKTCVAEFKGFPLGHGNAVVENYKLF